MKPHRPAPASGGQLGPANGRVTRGRTRSTRAAREARPCGHRAARGERPRADPARAQRSAGRTMHLRVAAACPNTGPGYGRVDSRRRLHGGLQSELLRRDPERPSRRRRSPRATVFPTVAARLRRLRAMSEEGAGSDSATAQPEREQQSALFRAARRRAGGAAFGPVALSDPVHSVQPNPWPRRSPLATSTNRSPS